MLSQLYWRKNFGAKVILYYYYSKFFLFYPEFVTTFPQKTPRIYYNYFVISQNISILDVIYKNIILIVVNSRDFYVFLLL